MAERDDSWFRVTLFAVRLEGKDGWIVDEAPMELAEIEAAIRSNGHPLAEIRQITCGASRCRNADGSPKTDGPMLWLVGSWGWTYDQQAQCWRAPGEMVREPDGVPERARLIVCTGSPDAGWWPLVISADGKTLEVWASNVYDPVSNLLAWLEQLIGNSAARVLIDEEGMHKEFLVYPKEQGLVRLVVLDHVDAAEKRIDVLLSLRNLVSQFYAAIKRLARDEALDAQWLREDECDPVRRPRMCSETVEAFLSGSDTG